MVAKNNPNEIRLIRTYDAPAQVVWDAWNEPDQRFCDESGELSRHPGLPIFPDALLMTVQFVPEDEATTRVTVVCEPLGDTNPEEIAVFLQTRSSMTGGWNASFNKLESLLL